MTAAERFWSHVVIGSANECWPFVGARGNSYGHGSIQWEGKLRRAHRVAYQLATGTILPDETKLRADTLCVLHTCDNPSCCNPIHLRLGTQGDNIRDASAKKRLLSGDANPSRRLPDRLAWGDANGSRQHPESRPRGSEQKAAKLKEQDIPAIRLRRAEGESLSAIAQTYSVSVNIIWRVCAGKGWAHI